MDAWLHSQSEELDWTAVAPAPPAAATAAALAEGQGIQQPRLGGVQELNVVDTMRCHSFGCMTDPGEAQGA